jgi:hypothetical protein
MSSISRDTKQQTALTLIQAQSKNSEADHKDNRVVLNASELQRREHILSNTLVALPKCDLSLKAVSFTPLDFILLCCMALEGDGYSLESPTITKEAAAAFKNPNIPFYKLTIEIPINVFKNKNGSIVLITHLINQILYNFLNAAISKRPPGIALSYAEMMNEKLPYTTIFNNFILAEQSQSKYTVCIGDNFQIEFPLNHSKGFNFTASPITSIRTSVFENWFQCVDQAGTTALMKQTWILSNPSADPLIACRKVIYNTRGFHFINDREVIEAALSVLRKDKDLINYSEYRKYINAQDDLGQIVGYLNWMNLIQNLPETEAKIYRDAINQRESKDNPFAAILCNKSSKETEAIFEWVQSILFTEAMQPNDAITHSDHLPQLAISDGKRTRFVTVAGNPLDQVRSLAAAWKTLSLSFADKKYDDMAPVFKRLQCKAVTLDAKGKHVVLKSLLTSAETGRLSQQLQKSKVTLNQLYETIQSIVDDRLIYLKLWNNQLTTSLESSKKENYGKESEELIKKLESITKISDDEFSKIVKMITVSEDYQLTGHLKTALVTATFILLDSAIQNPSLVNLQAIQKLIINLKSRKILSNSHLDKALEMLTQVHHLFKFNPKDFLHISLACEFLFLTSNWMNAVQQYVQVHHKLMDLLINHLPELLKSLNESDKQKLAFQIVITLIKQQSPYINSSAFRDVVNQLVLHSATSEIDGNNKIKNSGREFSLISAFKIQPAQLITLLNYVQPSFNSTMALQKILITLQPTLKPEEFTAIYEHLINFHTHIKNNEKNNPYIELICEFIFKFAILQNPPKGWADISQVLSGIILEETLKRMNSLNVDENERIVYKCIFTLLKLPNKESLKKYIPQLLNGLFSSLNTPKKEAALKSQEFSMQSTRFRQGRLELLAIAAASIPNDELKQKIQNYVLADIRTIISMYTDPGALQALLNPYNRVLLQLDICVKKIENLPQNLVTLRSNDSTPLKFLTAFTIFLHRIDPIATAPLYKILFDNDLSEALSTVFIAISTHLLDNKHNDLEIACNLFTNWVQGHIDVPPELLLNQTNALCHLVTKLLQLKDRSTIQTKLVQDILKHLEILFTYNGAALKEFLSTAEKNNKEKAGLSNSLVNIRLGIDTATISVFSQSAAKPFITTLFDTLVALNLIKRGSIKKFKTEVCNYDRALSNEENVIIFISFLNSKSFSKQWNSQIEKFCLKLFQRFYDLERTSVNTQFNEKDTKAIATQKLNAEISLQNSPSKQAENLAQYLFDKKLIKFMSKSLILQICLTLMNSENHILFTKFWDSIPKEFIFSNADLEYFAEKLLETKNPKKIKLIYDLYERSHFTHTHLFVSYVEGLSGKPADLKTVTLLVPKILEIVSKDSPTEMKVILASESSVKQANLNGMQIANLVYLAFNIGMSAKFCCKNEDDIRKLAETLSLLINDALKYVRKYNNKLYNDLATNIFYTCLASKNIDVQYRLGELCRQGFVNNPGQNAIKFLFNYFNFFANDSDHDLRELVFNLIKQCFENKWIIPTSSENTQIYLMLLKADSIESHYKTHLASRIAKLWLKQIINVKEAEEKNKTIHSLTNSHLVLLQVAKGFYKRFCYNPLKRIDAFYTSIFNHSKIAMDALRKYFEELLTHDYKIFSNKVALAEKDEESNIKSIHVINLLKLSSLFIKYRPQLGKDALLVISDSLVRYKCSINLISSTVHFRRVIAPLFQSIADKQNLAKIDHNLSRVLFIARSSKAIVEANQFLKMLIQTTDMNISKNFELMLKTYLNAHQIQLLDHIQLSLVNEKFVNYTDHLTLIFQKIVKTNDIKRLALCLILQLWYFINTRSTYLESRDDISKIIKKNEEKSNTVIRTFLKAANYSHTQEFLDAIKEPLDTELTYEIPKNVLFTTTTDDDFEDIISPIFLRLIKFVMDAYLKELKNDESNVEGANILTFILSIFDLFKTALSEQGFKHLQETRDGIPILFNELLQLRQALALVKSHSNETSLTAAGVRVEAGREVTATTIASTESAADHKTMAASIGNFSRKVSKKKKHTFPPSTAKAKPSSKTPETTSEELQRVIIQYLNVNPNGAGQNAGNKEDNKKDAKK